MFLKVVLTISYIITGVYILSIVMASVYCYTHGCKGPDLDAFMPAFFFTPLGAITTVFCLIDAAQHIKRRQWTWVFWPLAIIFSIILLGVVVLVALLIYYTAFHR